MAEAWNKLAGLVGENPKFTIVLAVLVVFVFILIVSVQGAKLEKAANGPVDELLMGASANQSISVQQFDGANMGAGSNADAQRLANASAGGAPGNFVSELALGGQAAHLRWCGVDDINAYKARGYVASKNPQGWVLNTNYEGEPSLSSVGVGREGARAVPDMEASMKMVGL
jgi:hypothetical protein